MSNEYDFELNEGQPASNGNFTYLNGMVRTAYDRMNVYSKKTLSIKHLDTVVAYAVLNESKNGKRMYIEPIQCINSYHPDILNITDLLINEVNNYAKSKKINDISLLIHNDSETLYEFFRKRKFNKAIDYYNRHTLLTKCI